MAQLPCTHQAVELFVSLTVIVDASDLCHQATFDFSGTATSRQFDIKGISVPSTKFSPLILTQFLFYNLVTQFACGDEMGGKTSIYITLCLEIGRFYVS